MTCSPRFWVWLAVLLAAGCTSAHHTNSPGAVVSVSTIASEVGSAVLRRGGNAVDASIATAFALAVTDPEAGNIGGGGFMLIAGPTVPPTVIDYRETAPAAASVTMFATTRPAQALLVGVPGTVRGLAAAHKKFGHLPWKDLVTPAIHLASDGFALDLHAAKGLNKVLASSPNNSELHRVFAKPGGAGWQVGDLFQQPDLARTLSLIADQGPDVFYRGQIAQMLANEMQSTGGIITLADLADYQPVTREPIHGAFRDFDIYSVPPPSSGGVALIEILNILENFDLRSAGRWSPRTLHLIIEAMRRAYCDRACYLGDPDFAAPYPPKLLKKSYARQLASEIDPTRATPSASLAQGRPIPLTPPEPDHTTHFSVIDANGLAVSNTYTIEELFGSRIVVHGAGFLLNNELGDFNPRPGVTDRSGLIGTPPNLVQPRKHPLSSMAPTIVMRHGKIILITGSPGGRTIINTVLQVVLNVTEFNMSPRDAVDAPRIHHQWFPDTVTVEPTLAREHPETIDELRAMGHQIKIDSGAQGDAHTIGIDPETGQVFPAPDQRKNKQSPATSAALNK